MNTDIAKQKKRLIGNSIIESHLDLNILMEIYDSLQEILIELKKPK